MGRSAEAAGRRSPALLAAAAGALLLALLPGTLLTGSLAGLEPELAARLALGAWIWRGGWLALGAFLAWASGGWASGAQAGLAEPPGAEPADGRGARRALLALTLLALVLRLPGLDLGLWFDELWMLVEFVRADLGKSLRSFPADNHHPLTTALSGLSVRAFGEAPWSLRLPALAFGVAGIPALFLFARPVVGTRGALFAAALLAVSSHHVSFSQSARGYTALLLLTLLSGHGLLAGLRTGARRAWLLQGAALGLATFAHTTALFLAAAQLLVWLAARDGLRGAGGPLRRRAPLLGLLLGGLVSVALHGLMLPQMVWFFVLREGTAAVEAEWTSPLWTVLEAARSLGLGTAAGLAALAAAAAVALVGLARVGRREASAALLCVLPGLVGAAVTLALGRNLWPRFFFFCAGFALLLASQGLEGLLAPLAARLAGEGPRARRLLAGAELAVVLAVSLLLPRAWLVPKQDYAAARDWVLAHAGPEDAVLTVGLASFPYADYYGGGFTPVETVADYERAAAGKDEVFVLSTFTIFLRSRHPELHAHLAAHTREVARFPGSIGDGDVVVLRAGP